MKLNLILNNFYKKFVSGVVSEFKSEFSNMNSNDIFLIVLSIISLFMTYKHIGRFMLLGVLVVSIIGYSFTRDIIHSIAIAMITINILVLLNLSGYSNIEYFENSNTDSSGNKIDASGNKIDASGNKIDASENQIDASGNKVNTTDNKVEDDTAVNVRESFLEAYKSLTPDQVNGLNTDTKQLIQTQQQLLETLKNMGPALQEGQTILNTFKQYFGSDTDLEKSLKDLKSL